LPCVTIETEIAVMTIIKSCVASLAAFLLCQPAIGAEPDSAEPPPSTAFARLQSFTSRASDLALHAVGMIGIRYKYGGDAPESGLDCSGLVRYVFKEVLNKELPRTSHELSQVGKKVDTRDLQPGDLVFYNTLRRSFSHVGIYLGDNKFIHAPSAGGAVRIESMDVGYWKKRFNGARRVSETEQQ
jgi:cell wall-associated NlpC family hydrolase